MLQCRPLSWGRRKLGASQRDARGQGTFRVNGSGLSSFCALPCGSSTTPSIGSVRSLHTWNASVRMDADRGAQEVSATEDGGRVDTFERPRLRESASDGAEMSAVVLGLGVEEGLEDGDSEQVRVPEMHPELSYEETMERWEFLKRLPHKLVRDVGYIVAGPPLLSTSKELPTVNPSTLGASSNQWPRTKAWLEQLPIRDVETWFASQKTSHRLGDHFAHCIEYVLRHSPHVDVHHLLTSQQVLQRVTKPVRSRGLNALESKSRARRDMSDTTAVDEPTHLLGSTDPHEKSAGTDAAEGKPGKRELKFLKKRERKQLHKGSTNTIGEFDYLFEVLTEGGSNEELHHWEVSVKYLLYAGPWEVFGLVTPESATWATSGAGNGSNGVHSEDGPTTAVNDFILGLYFGPQHEETLLDRKDRLRNQLKLSANPFANLMLQGLYRNDGNEVDSSNSVSALQTPELQAGADMGETAKEDGSGESLTRSIPQNSIEESKHLTVVASALLKGCLFYEYELWAFLESQGLQEAAGDAEVSRAQGRGETATQDAEKARLSRAHSVGWWTRDVMEFADLPRHRHSKWYIVPKLEWLSPVVVPAWAPERCARVLSLSDFVLKASQIAEEAGRLDMPMKRRFLVAELRWTPDWEHCHEDDLHTPEGAWLEVSRGFVVEHSWPGSRILKQHGDLATRPSGL